MAAAWVGPGSGSAGAAREVRRAADCTFETFHRLWRQNHWLLSAARRSVPLGRRHLALWLDTDDVTRDTARSVAAVFALIGLALTYGMIGNIVALIGTIFAERLMYLPSAFVAMLLAVALSRISIKIAAPLLSVVIALYALRSITYAAAWNDRLSFYDISLREQPDSIRLHILLANEYRLRGQFDEAARCRGARQRAASDLLGHLETAGADRDRPEESGSGAGVPQPGDADPPGKYGRGAGIPRVCVSRRQQQPHAAENEILPEFTVGSRKSSAGDGGS